LNAVDGKGNTPLHLAALGGHYDVLVLLLEKGVDRSILNQDGKTPLGIAEAKLREAEVKRSLNYTQTTSGGTRRVYTGRVVNGKEVIDDPAALAEDVKEWERIVNLLKKTQ